MYQQKMQEMLLGFLLFFIFLHLEGGNSLQDILEFEEALC